MNNTKNLEIARQRIHEVRLKKLLFLDLSGLCLNDIPEDISDLTFLLDLNISYNHFNSIPKAVESLIKLQYLNASHNTIFSLNINFEKHISLKEIDISCNSINFVPEELEYLPEDSLVIYFDNPFLNGLPVEIENQSFSDVCYYLDLIKNQSDVFRFYETKLLFVGNGEVGKTTLAKVLKDENFQFVQGIEPVTHGIQIDSVRFDVLFPASPPHYTSFRDIENVYLFQSEIEDEDEIEGNYDENIFDNVSTDKVEYEDINGVYVSENHKIVPISEELIHYEELVNVLMFQDNLTYFFENALIEKEVLMNLWDFGGQEIYHTTHQFFLTKRSIYLFVWEPRKDYNQDEFDYWLNTIRLLSANSPVLVVMNKADVRHINIDIRSLKERFSNIVAFINVSCKTRQGIDTLKNEIKKCVSVLPHMGNQIPKSWIKIRNEITLIKSDFITYTEFASKCKKFGNVDMGKELHLLSDYLHDVGEIIHFKEDSVLKNIVIINPQWATKAVYALIDTIPVQKSNGIFSVFDLENYWDLKIYPVEQHLIIVQLMEKFEICFKLIGAKDIYVIPELLKTEISNPAIIHEINSDDTIRLQIEYDFMPSGIVTKLICKLYSLIYKDSFWKNGAIFQHELSIGYIINDVSKKVLNVVVSGKQKGNLLAIIRNELNLIHHVFNMKGGLDYKEKIPCICGECRNSKTPFYFEYDVLKAFLTKEKTQIHCYNSTDNVDINLLISGYATVKPTRNLIYNIVSAASHLQGQNKIIVPNEDARNSFISDRLSINGVLAKDQSHWGKSGTGKNQGKLDIKIEDGEGNVLTIFEGLNLKNIDKQNINSHIDKTIKNYDPNGLLEKYICIYYDGLDFIEFCKKYFAYVDSMNCFLKTFDESGNFTENTEIKVFKSTYERSERNIYLVHILINMN